MQDRLSSPEHAEQHSADDERCDGRRPYAEGAREGTRRVDVANHAVVGERVAPADRQPRRHIGARAGRDEKKNHEESEGWCATHGVLATTMPPLRAMALPDGHEGRRS